MSTSGFPPPPPRPPQFSVPQRSAGPVTSGKAIAAFVLGLFSLFFWFTTALPAIVLAILARGDINRDPERVSGKGLANVGILLALVGLVLPPLMTVAVVQMLPGGKVTTLSGGPTAAHIHLSGPLSDALGAPDPLAIFGTQGTSLVELLRAIKIAEQDDNIEALVLTVDSFFFGAAQREELTQAFQAFKAAGKPIFAHTTTLDTSAYALLAHATHLSMAPTEMLPLTGLYSEGMYFKEALESIHAEVQVVHIGDFKAAGEPFTRSGPSPAADENTNWLLDGLYENLVDTIATAREMSASQVKDAIDGGLYTVDEAEAMGLIDSVQFVDEFLETIQGELGEDVSVDDRYFDRLRQQWQEAGPGIAQFAENQSTSSFGSDPIVGIVSVSGMILPGYGDNAPLGTDPNAFGDVIRKVLNNAERDEDVAAVVLRVDSPGGSVTASEVILRAVARLQEKKPVIVSMGNVAASGGYYVAALADTIYADASTVTGSIGVVGGKPVIGGIWDELGVGLHANKRGENADMFSLSKPFNETQIGLLRSNMESAYERFKDHVRTGRGDKLQKPLHELTGGRVFTGQQALELGLVDEIGSLQDAVAYAAEAAGLDTYQVQMLPETKDFWTLFFEGLSGTADRPSDLQNLVRAAQAQPAPAPLGLVQQLDPAKARALRQAFTALQLMHRETVLVYAPELTGYGL